MEQQSSLHRQQGYGPKDISPSPVSYPHHLAETLTNVSTRLMSDPPSYPGAIRLQFDTMHRIRPKRATSHKCEPERTRQHSIHAPAFPLPRIRSPTKSASPTNPLGRLTLHRHCGPALAYSSSAQLWRPSRDARRRIRVLSLCLCRGQSAICVFVRPTSRFDCLQQVFCVGLTLAVTLSLVSPVLVVCPVSHVDSRPSFSTRNVITSINKSFPSSYRFHR